MSPKKIKLSDRLEVICHSCKKPFFVTRKFYLDKLMKTGPRKLLWFIDKACYMKEADKRLNRQYEILHTRRLGYSVYKKRLKETRMKR